MLHRVPDRAPTVTFGLSRKVPVNTLMVTFETGQCSLLHLASVTVLSSYREKGWRAIFNTRHVIATGTIGGKIFYDRVSGQIRLRNIPYSAR